MITFKARTASGEIVRSALSPFQFPAGEAHTKREDRREIEPVEIAVLQPSPTSLHDDLFQLAMWHDYLIRTAPDTKRALVMPYIPGARADRGEPFGADIYTEFVGQMCHDFIGVYDPHSEVSEDLLADYLEDPKRGLAILRPADVLPKHLAGHRYDGVIAPDKGARFRASSVARALGIPVHFGEKTRDFSTGKLTGYQIPSLNEDQKYLVVDDICDGGGTFILLAEAAKVPQENLDLYVSHGIFSKDAHYRLTAHHYGRIITTNSFKGDYPAPGARNHATVDVVRPLLDAIPDFGTPVVRKPADPVEVKPLGQSENLAPNPSFDTGSGGFSIPQGHQIIISTPSPVPSVVAEQLRRDIEFRLRGQI